MHSDMQPFLTHVGSRNDAHKSFTLIEMLLAVSIVGVIAAIVVSAINPKRMLTAAQDASRSSHAKQYQNAINQYFIDNGAYPGTLQIGIENARPICQYSKSDAGCLSLDALVSKYLATLPVDPAAASAGSAYTGFYAYLQDANHVAVFSLFQGTMAGDGIPLTAPISNLLGLGTQLTCYDNSGNVISCAGTGQEGEFGRGQSANRFSASAGVVTDSVTGLQWQQASTASTYTWSNAGDYCTGLGGGWRLPTHIELLSIADFTSVSGTALNAVFTPTNSVNWSSTTTAVDTNYALYVSFSGSPALSSSLKTNLTYVRCVKSMY